jgi:putative transposase
VARALPVNSEFLDVALGYTEERVVSSRGIELDNLFYNDEDLAMVRRTLEPHKKVIVKRDPSDLSLIHVYDEKHDKYLAVPAVDQAYTKGLTLYQHTVISRYVRERLKRSVDIVALARAKREVQEIVQREWDAARGKQLGRKRAARFLKEGVQNNREGIERPNDVYDGSTPRISAPTKPTLLLPPSNSPRSVSDIETEWKPTDTDGEGEPTNLQLVRPGNTAAVPNETRSSKNGKANKRPDDRKSDTAHDPSSGKRKKAAKQKANKAAQLPADQPDEKLDMTGWSADYNLPR